MSEVSATRRSVMKGAAGTAALMATGFAATAGASSASAGPAWRVPYPGLQGNVGTYGMGYGPNSSRAYPVAYYRGSVKNIQRRLGQTQDGYIGPATDRAIRSFQRSHGLASDGIVGRATAAKMGMRWIYSE